MKKNSNPWKMVQRRMQLNMKNLKKKQTYCVILLELLKGAPG